eukprot:scaffold351_cov248-Pinguiococcus_pyrenoidosus.AAC.2
MAGPPDTSVQIHLCMYMYVVYSAGSKGVEPFAGTAEPVDPSAIGDDLVTVFRLSTPRTFECICRLPTARYTEVDNSGTLLGCGGVKPFRRPSGRGATALLLESRVKAGSC